MGLYVDMQGVRQRGWGENACRAICEVAEGEVHRTTLLTRK